MPYLFAAYTVTWVVFFVYLFFTSRRQNELEREVTAIRETLDNLDSSKNDEIL
ncbi:CcmD family protein [SAR202 cluster bacterium AD-804-J14_MRT_500m]|nr:CcmD family protein [SAR202 cluster bacterium AD-804-J14_MRT_500m]